MENVIGKVIENSVIGGAFIYLLYYMITRVSVIMEKISSTLEGVAQTLLKIDLRMGVMEERIKVLEELERGRA